MAEITANGVRFHVQRLTARKSCQVDPPTVIFVHGLISNLSSFFFPLANAVADAGAEVLLYDMRGRGFSERPPTGYSVSDSVADLDALLDALGVCGSVHLVGRCYGGTVALGFAIGHPERVASLVLIEAAVVGERWAEGIDKWIVGARARLAQGGQAYRRRRTTLEALVNGTTLMADLRTSRPFSAEELSTVTCPVQAICGAESRTLHHAYRLDELLPRYTLTILPGYDHNVLAYTNPAVVRDILLAWLALESAPHSRSSRETPY